MRIKNKKKFLVRVLELLIIIVTIILTILAINYANRTRGHQAIGGEYLVPLLGFIAIMVIEDIYQESEKSKGGKR